MSDDGPVLEPLDGELLVGVHHGGMRQVGRRILVTSRRLLLVRRDRLRDIRDRVAREVADGVPHPDGLARLLDAIGPLDPRIVDLRDVVAVRAGRGPSLLRAPELFIDLADGSSLRLVIVASPNALNFRAANRPARDTLVAQLQAAVEAVRASG